ncbi:MAG TPA: glycerate kinase [Baekduia sp.]|uniref:glycerate kinase family protein n=1 Tax=Baekduia sp. TaxID=2600305 RepID=UPI002D79CE9D|nr:glycerate kinase [Baekduia sp.]HET6507856.1 glycerate kinase [Baekduia sp.]
MILVAPDSFKGTFSAAEVADAVAVGVESSGVGADRCPVADGGEGTLDVVVRARPGGRMADVACHDPLGRPVTGAIGWTDDGATAIVEMAQASGLGLVAPALRDAERASTYGTGELIVAAAAAGARRIVVTVGGSATSDGGRGAIAAVRAAGGLGAAELAVACDVETPFEDAARVFGPQKGADPAAVARLTAALHEQAAALPRDPRGVAMTGAAGGLAGGLWAALGAELLPGAAWVLDAIGFDARLRSASAVVTGEGCLDEQTLQGKIIGEVARRCRAARLPLHAVVGTSRLDGAAVAALGLASVAEATDPPAMTAAGRALGLGVAAR